MIEFDRDMLSEAVIAYAIKHNEALSNDELENAMNQAIKGIENKAFTVEANNIRYSEISHCV